MKLFLSGRSAAEFQSKLPPLILKAKKALDASTDGELFTTKQLSALVGHGATVLLTYAYLLPTYSHNVRHNKKYWGKPATINELRKELKRK